MIQLRKEEKISELSWHKTVTQIIVTRTQATIFVPLKIETLLKTFGY